MMECDEAHTRVFPADTLVAHDPLPPSFADSFTQMNIGRGEDRANQPAKGHNGAPQPDDACSLECLAAQFPHLSIDYTPRKRRDNHPKRLPTKHANKDAQTRSSLTKNNGTALALRIERYHAEQRALHELRESEPHVGSSPFESDSPNAAQLRNLRLLLESHGLDASGRVGSSGQVRAADDIALKPLEYLPALISYELPKAIKTRRSRSV
eukprot:Rhum_TRINITY_DN20642_c0_g1::Rhum_TRINITY_DN20642_c0_g1_i1::g.171542::m.171542